MCFQDSIKPSDRCHMLSCARLPEFNSWDNKIALGICLASCTLLDVPTKLSHAVIRVLLLAFPSLLGTEKSFLLTWF